MEAGARRLYVDGAIGKGRFARGNGTGEAADGLCALIGRERCADGAVGERLRTGRTADEAREVSVVPFHVFHGAGEGAVMERTGIFGQADDSAHADGVARGLGFVVHFSQMQLPAVHAARKRATRERRVRQPPGEAAEPRSAAMHSAAFGGAVDRLHAVAVRDETAGPSVVAVPGDRSARHGAVRKYDERRSGRIGD